MVIVMFDIDLNKYNVIDISFLVTPGEDPVRPFEMERAYLADRSYKFDVIKTHSHVGTHVEASSHFFDDGMSVEKYELSVFFGRGILLDIDPEICANEIDAKYVSSAIGDIIKENDIIICRNKRQDAANSKRYFARDAALYFKEKKTKMIAFGKGVGIGNSIEKTRDFHEILMRDTVFLEIIQNLEKINRRIFFVMALPVLIKGIDSSWCRAVIIEEK